MTTNPTAARRLDIRMTGADRALLASLQAALASPMMPPPAASAVIRAALRELNDRVTRERSNGL